jgi:hypothetical protein
MSDQNELERIIGGAVIPKMQAVNQGNVEKKGAPIPHMQPLQGQTSTGGEQSSGAGESGQSDNKE